MGQGLVSGRVCISVLLMVVWPVGMRDCVVVIEPLPAKTLVVSRAVVAWGTALPERRDMKFRPRGEVLKRAVGQLSSVVDSQIGIWGELSSVARGHPKLEELRRNAITSMVGSKANNTLKTYLPYTVKWARFAGEFGFEEY